MFLECSLVELLIEDATLLINFDNGGACIICDHSSSGVALEGCLLSEWYITWILLGEGIFVPDGDMRVDEGIGGADVDETIWIVSL